MLIVSIRIEEGTCTLANQGFSFRHVRSIDPIFRCDFSGSSVAAAYSTRATVPRGRCDIRSKLPLAELRSIIRFFERPKATRVTRRNSHHIASLFFFFFFFSIAARFYYANVSKYYNSVTWLKSPMA
ncbi:hypothetical protein M378DRAFT_287717 [Amanita muscaria Koide BX008]|uniref:Uncharacterized protein n=1 Tax=Amanita muscaria (strain Koide BX008) TaxID=946122 RepID=A0A0C2SXR1_AMAMK|nr:hypothetical protein M378DRAFT_287717 [Amanita muscaria Koide BX008]